MTPTEPQISAINNIEDAPPPPEGWEHEPDEAQPGDRPARDE